MTGGSEADSFVFSYDGSYGMNNIEDVITDFQHNSDTLRLIEAEYKKGNTVVAITAEADLLPYITEEAVYANSKDLLIDLGANGEILIHVKDTMSITDFVTSNVDIV